MEKLKLERDSLFQETEKVLNAITSDTFLEKMKTFRSTKGEEREEFAKSNLTTNSLINEGVDLPQDMRVSSRTFEEGDPRITTYVDYEEGLRVMNVLATNRPDLLETLRTNNPDVFDGLKPYLPPSLGGNGPIINPGNPDNPRFPNIPDFPKPDTPDFPFPDDFDPAGAWACACGGAATVCGGAGGGS